MSKILARLVLLLGVATLIALGWFAVSQAGIRLPMPRAGTDGRLYAGGPVAALNRAWSRQRSRVSERSRALRFSFSDLWPGVTDNAVKMALGVVVLVVGWRIAQRVHCRVALGR
jgi:hypothetical protein